MTTIHAPVVRSGSSDIRPARFGSRSLTGHERASCVSGPHRSKATPTERAAGLALAVVIGIGLAAMVVHWAACKGMC